MTSDRTPVTVLGLGRMGATIAEVLLRNGHSVTVWNRSPGRAPQLDTLGAVRADTLGEALRAGALTIVSVHNTEMVAELLHAVPDDLADRTVLNLSTGRPEDARELADWTTKRHGRFLDGSILGMPETLGTPATTIVYSGSPEAEAEHHATIAELGTAKHLGADTGLAAAHDLAVLAGMYGLFGGFFQAMAMMRREQASATEFTRELLVPWLRSLLDTLPALATQIDKDEFPPTMASVEEHQMIVRMILDANRAQDLPTDLLDPVLALLDAGVARGNGTESLTRAVSVLLDHPVHA
ncbi:NAD(P)-dependent oxidoreductase [Nocardia altamirensis]|uniref:NAD(P)-dependent oxidoreductase n=1 Tax=Nocardia altamirensis TaxID=472158 RepID=UPI0008408A38|nr:NAD(P)-binding domain-containing protein [Nocardia altamirensis]